MSLDDERLVTGLIGTFGCNNRHQGGPKHSESARNRIFRSNPIGTDPMTFFWQLILRFHMGGTDFSLFAGNRRKQPPHLTKWTLYYLNRLERADLAVVLPYFPKFSKICEIWSKQCKVYCFTPFISLRRLNTVPLFAGSINWISEAVL